MLVLITALDWGLGHTMRIIPLIQEQILKGNTVVFAGSQRQFKLLKEVFPDLLFEQSSSSSPVFRSGNKQIFSWFSFLPRFFASYLRERKQIVRLVNRFQPDLIISDNRYGIYHKTVESIFLTHQLCIKVPPSFSIFSNVVNLFNARAINKFNTCLVPDSADSCLSGELSKLNTQITIPVNYIGIQSRFSMVQPVTVDPVPDVLFLISGPEHQRTVFENLILRAVDTLRDNISYLIVRGLESDSPNELLNALNNTSAGELKYLLQHAKAIVCRSGYSTLMDLVYLNKTALLIPTPGQSEQEYLACHVSRSLNFDMCKQNEFTAEKLRLYLKSRI